MTNEGNSLPDREPQSPSRSISQTVLVADVLGQTVYRDSNNHHAGRILPVCYLLSAICYLLSAICYLLSAICYCIQASGENAPDWMQLGSLREYSKVPDCSDYSGRNETAIDLNL
jgi:hypothetical protein